MWGESYIGPSVHPENFLKVIELADRYEGVYYTLGIHPCFVAKPLQML